ncbi:hypothetical protein NSIN_20426 [Nitrosotalea sinensis]|uniref:Uncharacterized protein n=1 Tax=Nitrosotalea sinensis TaxID=1499975 RepID=A0A2H1EH25_9ARCH|nr:hypothetical protein [Candidatus Nitrosotalea sinensis]SHO44750.1 hypothetical protein NSIN_20426 [Candidatus Nitrosotalea sinensis]
MANWAPDPESIISLAWSISGKYADSVEEQETAQRAESHFIEIKQKLMDNNQLAYANDIATSLLASSRTLALIVRHRNNNFDMIETLKTNEIDMYKKLQSFTGSLQSILPRLSGVAIGGSTIPALLKDVYSVSPSVSYLLIATFGGVGYILSEIISARIGGIKLNETVEKYGLKKDTEFHEYIYRSRLELRSLLDDLILSYRRNIDPDYDVSEDERNKIIKNIFDSVKQSVPKSKDQ